MTTAITPIALHYLVDVNCYAVETGGGWVLIDTGLSKCRADLDRRLEDAGCKPGGLRLIVLTHAHADHAGNCAYLREKHRAPIAMHAGDADRVRHGDMFWSADGKRSLASAITRTILSVVGLHKVDAFEPDMLVGDGQHLGEYGLDAKVIHLPGHSPGSIGVLTAAGDLFCGDLLTNTGKPTRPTTVDDIAAMEASIDRLGGLEIRKVHPGHGQPFPIQLLLGDGGVAG